MRVVRMKDGKEDGTVMRGATESCAATMAASLNWVAEAQRAAFHFDVKDEGQAPSPTC